MQNNAAAVISNYAPRGRMDVLRLIGQLKNLVDEVIVVVNDDLCQKLEVLSQAESVTFLRRPNTGMNIGAWSEAIPFVANKELSIFLQDECSLVDASFVARYKAVLRDSNVGMVGESMNQKWNRPWMEIAQSGLNYPVWLSDGRVISRVDYYISCMRQWKVLPSEDGSHLRALIWGFSSRALKKISHFPIGYNKEQCIAAEISVSKVVKQLGMDFCQSAAQPFSYFEHSEWRKDGVSKVGA
jgi:hypothetical protein